MAKQVGTVGKVAGSLCSEVILEKDGARAYFILPAISYDDFDRSGNFSIWKLNKLFWHARLEACFNSTFSDLLTMAREYGISRSYGCTSISQEFYTLTQQQKVNLSLKLVTEIVAIEDSRVWYMTSICNVISGDSLATLTFDVTFMNKEKTNQKALPDWFREKYEPQLDGDYSISYYFPPPLPNKAYSYTFEVLPSDTDANGQTRSSVYLRYSMDCASRAFHDGFYVGMSTDVSLSCAKTIQEFFEHECRDREKMVVYTWQNNDKPESVYFRIDCMGVACYHTVITFWDKKT